MKVSTILRLPTLKLILLLLEKSEARHAELARLIPSRGTLSLALKELAEEGLIQRRVVVSKPIQTYYSLTTKGRSIGAKLNDMAVALRANEKD